MVLDPMHLIVAPAVRAHVQASTGVALVELPAATWDASTPSGTVVEVVVVVGALVVVVVVGRTVVVVVDGATVVVVVVGGAVAVALIR